MVKADDTRARLTVQLRRRTARLKSLALAPAQSAAQAAQADAIETPAPPVPGPVTVVFTDMGQDFLEWDVDAKGVVIDSRPYQARVWVGKVLTRRPRPGEQLEFRSGNGQVHTIRYPVLEVRPLRAAPAPAAATATESP